MIPVHPQGETPQASTEGIASLGLPVGPEIPPLNVTGLVVTKADLIKALHIYIPQLADITSLDDDRFLLSLAPLPEAQNKKEGDHD